MAVPHLAVERFQGSQIMRVPESTGIYAWYYNPVDPSPQAVQKTLSMLLAQPGRIRTQVEMRYGVKWFADSPIRIAHGSSRRATIEVIKESFSSAESFIVQFLSAGAFPLFARPLYIGIAENLYNRVFRGHFQRLMEYWEDSSTPSRFLRSNPGSDISTVMEKTGLPHSFALEARICNIATKDLVVYVQPVDIGPDGVEQSATAATDDSSIEPDFSVKPLELLLQLLADPAFGRK